MDKRNEEREAYPRIASRLFPLRTKKKLTECVRKGSKNNIYHGEFWRIGKTIKLLYIRDREHFTRKHKGYGIDAKLLDRIIEWNEADSIIYITREGQILSTTPKQMKKKGTLDNMGRGWQYFMALHEFKQQGMGLSDIFPNQLDMGLIT